MMMDGMDEWIDENDSNVTVCPTTLLLLITVDTLEYMIAAGT